MIENWNAEMCLLNAARAQQDFIQKEKEELYNEINLAASKGHISIVEKIKYQESIDWLKSLGFIVSEQKCKEYCKIAWAVEEETPDANEHILYEEYD